ncbi:unnamed protein product [Danaus chrysippus]|uniref:(African queen) hypothetical protein n=1 Tax=Danaus chrysippus TaxID=151541 RepID=A0A8J2VVP3_9NEOP|nr:unnamed protein product [Danaus chrysippus]
MHINQSESSAGDGGMMRWIVVVLALVLVVEAAGPRRCAGRLARERLKAAEKIRDKRFYLFCCTSPCASPQRRSRPPPTTRRYQPFHKTWYGLKHALDPIPPQNRCDQACMLSESDPSKIFNGKYLSIRHITIDALFQSAHH